MSLKSILLLKKLELCVYEVEAFEMFFNDKSVMLQSSVSVSEQSALDKTPLSEINAPLASNLSS
jgi:hypothetical protein